MAIALIIGVSVLLLAISIVAVAREEPAWVTWTCWALFAFSLLGIADAVTQFLTLGEHELRMRRNLRFKRIPREDIESVSVAKGCPTLLILKDESKVELPPLDSIAMGNSVRAWIKATERSETRTE